MDCKLESVSRLVSRLHGVSKEEEDIDIDIDIDIDTDIDSESWLPKLTPNLIALIRRKMSFCRNRCFLKR